MKNISFSVIIPLYNKENTILSTIKSVLNQNYDDFEIIVINDGSTDNCAEIVNSITDKRIKLFTIKNQGVSAARNIGVEHSQNEYITFLDADDFWYNNHLTKLAEIISCFPNCNWCANAYEFKYTENYIIPMEAPPMHSKNNINAIDDFFANSMASCLAHTISVCMKKSFFKNLGGFDISLTNNQDVDLWIRAGLKSKLYFCNTITCTYNLTGKAHISKKNISKKTIIDFDKYENLYPNNNSLKSYLDYNRFSVAIRYKTIGDKDKFIFYTSKINKNNLTSTQNILLKMPKQILKFLFYIKNKSFNLKINFKTYK